MIRRHRQKAIEHLSISFALFLLAMVLIVLRANHFIPEMIFAVAMILVGTFGFIFYVRGNLALAHAKGYDDSVVLVIIIAAALCSGCLFFAMPLILIFGLKDKTGSRRHSHSEDDKPPRRNPPAVLPPRRDPPS